MRKSNKIEAIDLEAIRANQEKREILISQLGELKLRESRILGVLQINEDQSQKISSELAKKYGQVDINLETGEMSPRKEKK